MRSFPPSKEQPKYIKLSSLPAPPSPGSGAEAGPCQGHCPRRLTSVKCDRQGTAHRCKKKTYGQSGLVQRVPCARTRKAHEMKEDKGFWGHSWGGQRSPSTCWEQCSCCSLARLFGGEEFFCPLKKKQTFVFMSNTKNPNLSGSCRTLIPTRSVFLCRKGAGKLYHLPGEGTGPVLFESRRAGFCDFFHYLQFLLSDHSKLCQWCSIY